MLVVCKLIIFGEIIIPMAADFQKIAYEKKKDKYQLFLLWFFEARKKITISCHWVSFLENDSYFNSTCLFLLLWGPGFHWTDSNKEFSRCAMIRDAQRIGKMTIHAQKDCF